MLKFEGGVSRKAEGEEISREDAKTRRRERLGIVQVPQLSKTFCGNEGVMQCSGLTELWMGSSAPMEKIQSGVQPPHCKKQGSGLNGTNLT
jgi:hypothetical protein